MNSSLNETQVTECESPVEREGGLLRRRLGDELRARGRFAHAERTGPRAAAGFTLMEIMVVIAIIGLIATFVAPNILNRMTEAEIEGTRVKMVNLKGVISDYRRHHGKIPDSLDDLMQPSDKNLGEAYIEKEDQVLDAWKTPFEYRKIDSRKFEILSFGPDGLEGGEGVDSDISSLDGNLEN